MMMNSGNWETAALGYTTVEMLLEDAAANTNLTRFSRPANGQKAGGSMRIVKPNSASNSPRGSLNLGRRRTVMNDGAYRRRVAMLEQSIGQTGGYLSNDGLQIPIPPRAARPVSWHPASHIASQQQMYSSPFPTSTPEMNPQYQYFEPSTPAVYSAYASPASAFSPASIPFTGYQQQTFYQQPATSYQSNTFAVNQNGYIDQSTPTSEQLSSANTDSSLYSHFDWNEFAANGFDKASSTPPTPENFLPIQHPETAFPEEESIPYHPLSDTEDDGEELIGMGLYDTPETMKSSLDPQLENYRALMMTQLYGANYLRPEPKGKGLKLEETWNPPTSDDDDEEEDDDEQDGEGEDDDSVEEKQAPAQQPENVAAPANGYLTSSFQVNSVPQQYTRNGWL